MKEYDVTITATITKTYRVQAEDENQAYEEAHEIFSVLNDDAEEHYDQTTDSIVEVN